MATQNITRYFARVWDEDNDISMDYDWEHHYERNMATILATAALLYNITRFATYSIERLLLSNFPTLSREWCFTTASQPATKLQRAQLQTMNIAAAVAFFFRWPIGSFAHIHLWQSVAFVSALLVVAELSVVGMLGMMVGFIRVANYAAQITGWEHPSSPVRAFPDGNYSKEHRQFFSPAGAGLLFREPVQLEPMRDARYSEARVVPNKSSIHVNDCISYTKYRDHPSIKINGMDVKQNKKADEINTSNSTSTFTITSNNSDAHATNPTINNSSTAFTATAKSSFMGFSPVAFSSSTWLKTRKFANSIFSNSTQSTESRDSFGGPAIGRRSSLKYVENASDTSKAVEIPDLLTGTPRRNFA